MPNTQNRIPDEMLADILAEATRLHAAATAGYSFEDLQQACDEIQIPAHILKQAIANVQAVNTIRKQQRQQLQNFLKQQLLKGIPLGVAIFLGATPIVGFLRFYQFPEPLVVTDSLTKMTVKVGQLQYLAGPRDLSIAVRSIDSGRSDESGRRISGGIAMDGYPELPLEKPECREISSLVGDKTACTTRAAQVGESYTYQGLHTYQVKILAVDKDTVQFQIDRVNSKAASPAQRLEAQLKSLQQESEAAQKVLQERLGEVESNDRRQKTEIIQQANTIKELQQENQILKDVRRP